MSKDNVRRPNEIKMSVIATEEAVDADLHSEIQGNIDMNACNSERQEQVNANNIDSEYPDFEFFTRLFQKKTKENSQNPADDNSEAGVSCLKILPSYIQKKIHEGDPQNPGVNTENLTDDFQASQSSAGLTCKESSSVSSGPGHSSKGKKDIYEFAGPLFGALHLSKKPQRSIQTPQSSKKKVESALEAKVQQKEHQEPKPASQYSKKSSPQSSPKEVDSALDPHGNHIAHSTIRKKIMLPYFQLPKPDLDEFLVETEKNLNTVPVKSVSGNSHPTFESKVKGDVVLDIEDNSQVIAEKTQFLQNEASTSSGIVQKSNKGAAKFKTIFPIKEISNLDNNIPGIKRLALKEYLKKKIDEKKLFALNKSKDCSKIDEEIDSEEENIHDYREEESSDTESVDKEFEEETVTLSKHNNVYDTLRASETGEHIKLSKQKKKLNNSIEQISDAESEEENFGQQLVPPSGSPRLGFPSLGIPGNFFSPSKHHNFLKEQLQPPHEIAAGENMCMRDSNVLMGVSTDDESGSSERVDDGARRQQNVFLGSPPDPPLGSPPRRGFPSLGIPGNFFSPSKHHSFLKEQLQPPHEIVGENMCMRDSNVLMGFSTDDESGSSERVDDGARMQQNVFLGSPPDNNIEGMLLSSNNRMHGIYSSFPSYQPRENVFNEENYLNLPSSSSSLHHYPDHQELVHAFVIGTIPLYQPGNSFLNPRNYINLPSLPSYHPPQLFQVPVLPESLLAYRPQSIPSYQSGVFPSYQPGSLPPFQPGYFQNQENQYYQSYPPSEINNQRHANRFCVLEERHVLPQFPSGISNLRFPTYIPQGYEAATTNSSFRNSDRLGHYMHDLPLSQSQSNPDMFSSQELATICSGRFRSNTRHEPRYERDYSLSQDMPAYEMNTNRNAPHYPAFNENITDIGESSTTKPNVMDFFEHEAELSGDDDGDDEASESGDDADDESDKLIEPDHNVPAAEELRHEIIDLHQKQVRDDDDRALKQLQEKYIEDGELYGEKRARRFAWTKNDLAIENDMRKTSSESDSEAAHDDNWSALNKEKAKWRQENKAEDFTGELNSSAKKPPLKYNIVGNQKSSNRNESSSKNLPAKRPRGSFLHLDDDDSSHILKKLKTSEDNCGGGRTTKHFVFRNDLPGGSSSEAAKNPDSSSKQNVFNNLAVAGSSSAGNIHNNLAVAGPSTDKNIRNSLAVSGSSDIFPYWAIHGAGYSAENNVQPGLTHSTKSNDHSILVDAGPTIRPSAPPPSANSSYHFRSVANPSSMRRIPPNLAIRPTGHSTECNLAAAGSSAMYMNNSVGGPSVNRNVPTRNPPDVSEGPSTSSHPTNESIFNKM